MVKCKALTGSAVKGLKVIRSKERNSANGLWKESGSISVVGVQSSCDIVC